MAHSGVESSIVDVVVWRSSPTFLISVLELKWSLAVVILVMLILICVSGLQLSGGGGLSDTVTILFRDYGSINTWHLPARIKSRYKVNSYPATTTS